MDYRSLIDSLRPGLTDPSSGAVAPDQVWQFAALALGHDEPVQHAFGQRAEGPDKTLWHVTLLTETRIIRIVAKANFSNWGDNGRPSRSTDQTEVLADVQPMRALRSYSVLTSRPMPEVELYEVVGEYKFVVDGGSDLTIDVAATTNPGPRGQLEAAAQFLIKRLN